MFVGNGKIPQNTFTKTFGYCIKFFLKLPLSINARVQLFNQGASDCRSVTALRRNWVGSCKFWKFPGHNL